jgi:hypothetical protein
MGLTKTGHYLFEKRGYYYFSRRVPSDLKQSYRTSRIVLSLKTKSVHVAQSRAKSLGIKLEEEWQTLRLLNNQSDLSKYLITRSQVTGTPSAAPVLSKALEMYLDAKSKGKTKTFWQSAQRCIKFALDLLGDRPIDSYVRSEVNEIRDAYFKAGLKLSSIKRNLSTIRVRLQGI